MARTAFGPHNARSASPKKQAEYIAQSMQRFLATGEPKSLAFYGVTAESEIGKLVMQLMQAA